MSERDKRNPKTVAKDRAAKQPKSNKSANKMRKEKKAAKANKSFLG